MKHALKVSRILGAQLKRCIDRPALTRVFIDDGEQPVAASPISRSWTKSTLQMGFGYKGYILMMEGW